MVTAAFGAGLFAAGVVKWHDRAVLAEHGAVAAAEIVTVHSGNGHGVSVTVRFTTGAGQEIVADVVDPPVGPPLEPGAPLQVRYDTRDPAGRVIPANQNQWSITMWFLLVSGFALVALSGYGALWWVRHG